MIRDSAVVSEAGSVFRRTNQVVTTRGIGAQASSSGGGSSSMGGTLHRGKHGHDHDYEHGMRGGRREDVGTPFEMAGPGASDSMSGDELTRFA